MSRLLELIQVLNEKKNEDEGSIIKYLQQNDLLDMHVLEQDLIELEEVSKTCTLSLRIYILTYMINVSQSDRYIHILLDLLLEDNTLNENDLYTLYYHFVGLSFMSTKEWDEDLVLKMSKLYRKVYRMFRENIKSDLSFVPVEKRQKRYVVVFVSQFLNCTHGPTKTVLDRCEIIAKKTGLTPFIINTAEIFSDAGSVETFGQKYPNYLAENLDLIEVSYEEFCFPFVQCDYGMPNNGEIENIIQAVKRINPYYLLEIGGSSITADICSNMYPLINVNTVPSGKCDIEGQFQLIGRDITDADRRWINMLGKNKNHLIKCLFTSSIVEMQSSDNVTRETMGFPINRLIALIVGGRLDQEIKDDFLQMLDSLAAKGYFIVFMGGFETYSQKVLKYNMLKQNSQNLGYITNVLPIYNLCDVYVNPKRTGGGTSVIEAMVHGKPAVTLPYGDVSLGVAEEFIVSSYEEMENRLTEYINNKHLYSRHSEIAKERAHYMLDGESKFVDALNKIEQLDEFKYAFPKE